jgi:hypothetical protein
MIELIRTNDLVLIAAAESLLREKDIFLLVVDQNASALGFSAQRRLCVLEDQAEEARKILREAGFGGELRDE